LFVENKEIFFLKQLKEVARNCHVMIIKKAFIVFSFEFWAMMVSLQKNDKSLKSVTRHCSGTDRSGIGDSFKFAPELTEPLAGIEHWGFGACKGWNNQRFLIKVSQLSTLSKCLDILNTTNFIS
jgi:hypothetical protein